MNDSTKNGMTDAQNDAMRDAMTHAARDSVGETTPQMIDSAQGILGPNEPTLNLSPEFSAEEVNRLSFEIVEALKSVFDPEIPADIYELGLIYRVEIDDSRFASIDMTLTAPGCPVAGEMPKWVEDAVAAVPGVAGVKVNMVFDPPWDQSRMSDIARIALDMW